MTPADLLLSQIWAIHPDSLMGLFAVADRLDPAVTLAPEAVAARAGRPMDGARCVEIRDGVAVLPVRGVLSRYDDFWSWLFGGSSVETLAKDLRTAVDNPMCRAVILDIDSPGGMASGISEFAAQIRDAGKVKPVVCYASTQAASAAYWLASACSELVISDAAMLGSIGTVQAVAAPKKDGEKRTIEFVSSQSPNKRPDPTTEKGRTEIQSVLDAMTDVFINAVAKYRNCTPEKVMGDFGAGGQKIGQAAVDAGMADRLGDLESLIAEYARGGRAGKPPSFNPHGAAVVVNQPGKNAMKLSMTAVMAYWFGKGQPDTIETDEIGANATQAAEKPAPKSEPAATVDIEAIRREARDEAMRASAESARKDREALFATQALAWAADQVKGEKITPAESAAHAAKYVALAMADAYSPLSLVLADGKTEPVCLLGDFKAGIEARKPNVLTKETVPTDAAAVRKHMDSKAWKTLDSAATDPTEADEQAQARERRRVEMLSATDEGRAILAAEKK